MNSKKVLLLGASGSIGRQSLDVIDESKGKFILTAFSVGHKVELIPKLLKKYKKVTSIYLISKEIAKEYSKKYPKIKFYSSRDGLAKFVKKSEFDICVNALVGFVGLEPSLEVLKKDKILCLANKETLVAGGTLINSLLAKGKGKLYPIDSEHVALAKCLSRCKLEDVKQLIITASGGALRNVPINKLNTKKAVDALKHPTWNMGKKITIDCATMMNKGFEVIEAYYLFGFTPDKVKVLMHDESLVHSAVELKDGTILIDYGKPDMHNPIKWAMYEGDVKYKVLKIKDFKELKNCHFHNYDAKRYPCCELAKDSLRKGASRMVVLNAVNEVMVNKYLKDEINFLDISRNVKKALENTKIIKNPSLNTIKKLDSKVRKETY